MTELRTILLAEDNVNDVELTLAALRQNRLLNDVVVVRDGAEALDFLYRRNQFSARPGGSPVVMLLDLKMPKVDGLEVLRQVKGDPEMRAMPIVVLTSSREEQDLANQRGQHGSSRPASSAMKPSTRSRRWSPRSASAISSAPASSAESAVLYGRAVVSASNTSTMAMICANSGMASPRSRSG